MSYVRIRRIVREVLSERRIGQALADVTVNVRVDLTRHADERRYRHGRADEITEEEIVATAEVALDRVVEDLIEDILDVGDEFLIRDTTYDLNLVAILERTGRPGVLDMTVITVMRKRGFRAKPGTHVIEIT